MGPLEAMLPLCEICQGVWETVYTGPARKLCRIHYRYYYNFVGNKNDRNGNYGKHAPARCIRDSASYNNSFMLMRTENYSGWSLVDHQFFGPCTLAYDPDRFPK